MSAASKAMLTHREIRSFWQQDKVDSIRAEFLAYIRSKELSAIVV
jgi:hypothetical protein